jgi:hypothetical protein
MGRSFSILLFCVVGCVASRASRGEEPIVFETEIQPLLAQKCGKCHGDKVRKGDLDLSTMVGVRRGGESGEPLVAESSLDESLLWAMVDGDEMPPEDEDPLTDEEKSRIRRWLEAGAKSNVPLSADSKSINQHDVLPIVLLRCTTCHGPRLQQGGLDLRTPASMLKGGKNGPALVPGDPDASLMIQRVESEACPPRDQLLKFFVRRPPESEVERLREWIEAGAPIEDIKPDVATTQPDALVTEDDRQHWAYKPPQSSPGATIDGFVERRLEKHGLSRAEPANRDALIRRAYIDLIGMPPSLEQWRHWRTREDAQWYAEMIDALLDSPRYGERWGRYWLDLAGYADSEGGISSDPLRTVAWKYRDYVIDAFNEDKPYDRFLLEQLAGDELVDHANADVITQEMVDNLIATGFLRMGIDETGSRTMNFVPERIKVISDTINIVGSGLMGMTMECARCHSHKYDAIPHRDYYRFKAVFQGALDEHDWSSFKTRSLNVATKEHQVQVRELNPALQKEVKKRLADLKTAGSELQLALLRHHYPDQAESDNLATIAALKVADNNRSLRQRNLVEQLQRVEVLPTAQQPESVLAAERDIEQLKRDIDGLKRQMAPPLAIRALWDFGRPSPTYILRRGEYNKPGPLVGPGVPAVLTDGKTPFVVEPPFPKGTPKTGRRLAFARWLTAPDHPLTARVMVNRIWHHHFGTGLVKDLDNFGVKGERPSHPEMLDWLAVEFVESGWSIKRMHRLIMNSETYRQSSRVTPNRQKLDPQNRLLSRMSLRRLDAEALRDSLLFVCGKLNDAAGGIPDTVSVSRDGLVSVNPTDSGGWRRSVYLQYRRTEIPSMMATFDYPKMGPNCVMRSVSNISPQALMLMNDRHVRDLAAALAERVNVQLTNGGESGASRLDETVDLVYGLTLSRAPTAVEKQLGMEGLAALEVAWKDEPEKALETYCHTLLNLAAFLYVD